MKTETINLNKERNVFLRCYISDGITPTAKLPAVLVLPGGAYLQCDETEAEPVALKFVSAGFQAFVLNYSVSENAVWPNPLDDYEQAIKYIKCNAEILRIASDKIAVIGFSAGGHLAACAATIAKITPNAVLLGYAATCGDDKAFPDTLPYITHDTPPVFLFATYNDRVIPVQNTTKWATALADNGVPFECHIYHYGEHGFSIADNAVETTSKNCSRVKNWVCDGIEWLREVFDYGRSELYLPTFVDEHSSELSIKNSIAHLIKFEQARTILRKYFPFLFDTEKVNQGLFGTSSIQTLEEAGLISKELSEQIDCQLKHIKNAK